MDVAVLHLTPLAAVPLGFIDGELVCVLLGVIVFLWVIIRAFSANDSNQTAKSDPLTSPFPTDYSPIAFDPIRDADSARGLSPMFGFPVVFSSRLEAEKYPNIVTGITLNRDYVAVRRGTYGVRAFLLDESLTVSVTPGCPPGFHERSDYMMELGTETEVARFPISFSGWLQFIDAARRGGAVIELEPGLPGPLKYMIETPLPGDEDIKPVRTKAAGAKSDGSREAGRCKACGAGIGRKSSCDYCGASQ